MIFTWLLLKSVNEAYLYNCWKVIIPSVVFAIDLRIIPNIAHSIRIAFNKYHLWMPLLTTTISFLILTSWLFIFWTSTSACLTSITSLQLLRCNRAAHSVLGYLNVTERGYNIIIWHFCCSTAFFATDLCNISIPVLTKWRTVTCLISILVFKLWLILELSLLTILFIPKVLASCYFLLIFRSCCFYFGYNCYKD